MDPQPNRIMSLEKSYPSHCNCWHFLLTASQSPKELPLKTKAIMSEGLRECPLAWANPRPWALLLPHHNPHRKSHSGCQCWSQSKTAPVSHPMASSPGEEEWHCSSPKSPTRSVWVTVQFSLMRQNWKVLPYMNICTPCRNKSSDHPVGCQPTAHPSTHPWLCFSQGKGNAQMLPCLCQGGSSGSSASERLKQAEAVEPASIHTGLIQCDRQEWCHSSFNWRAVKLTAASATLLQGRQGNVVFWQSGKSSARGPSVVLSSCFFLELSSVITMERSIASITWLIQQQSQQQKIGS